MEILPSTHEHGTTKRYSISKCRCQPCKDAWSQYAKELRTRRRAAPKDPNDPRHGTASFYRNHGCKCDRCTEAATDHSRVRREENAGVILPEYIEKFWANVNKTDSCWLWTGSTRGLGYGQCSYNGHFQGFAHRMSYELANGEIPDGQVIDHICHTPLCVRPDHLRSVTNKQNQEHRLQESPNSTSGLRGITWYAAGKKWKAEVKHNYVVHHVGYFFDLEDAKSAVIAKRNELFTHNNADRRAA